MTTAEPVQLDTRSGLEEKVGNLREQPDSEPNSLISNKSGGDNVDLSSSSPSASLGFEEGSDISEEVGGGGVESPIRCSAVHTLERDMPDYDYTHLIEQLRLLILEHAESNPGTYSEADMEKCRQDDWFLSRYLLRQKMDLELAFEMLKQALRFNHESLANHLRPEDFPAEFYQLGGMIPYGHDRKGNKMLYLRVQLHKKIPEITSILQAFVYYNIKRRDDEAQGKGISIVIDCTGAGLANADMDTLLFIITTLKNYFPKGLSYFLVHELPWILKPFWHIAKNWIPQEHRELIKFSDSNNINEYIDQDQLPDFMGGPMGEEHYKRVPEDCVRLEQAAKMWGIEGRLVRRVLNKFKDDLPRETVERIENFYSLDDDSQAQETSQQQEKGAGNQMFCN